MKVLITGATGLVGQQLVKQLLRKNIVVHYFTTSKNKITKQKNYKGFYWNPLAGEMDENAFEGVTTIVHLAGTSIVKRWTSHNKKEILESRLKPIDLFFNYLSKNKHTIEHFVSASAIGIYPTDYSKIYTETETQVDDSFLGEVVEKWESQADKLLHFNIKVTKIRIGLVLSNLGGMLPTVLKTVKYGIGSCFGNGKQYQSWIHIDDLAQLFLFVIQNKLIGIFNAVAPNPVTHKEFMLLLAKKLKRKLWLPAVPKFVMTMILGEQSYLLYASQRVSSQKIIDEGFSYQFSNLEEAFDDLV